MPNDLTPLRAGIIAIKVVVLCGARLTIGVTLLSGPLSGETIQRAVKLSMQCFSLYNAVQEQRVL